MVLLSQLLIFAKKEVKKNIFFLGKRAFYDPLRINSKFKELAPNIFSFAFVGLPLGSEKNPSPSIIDLLDLPILEINEKSAWLFICGRDIFINNIINNYLLSDKELLLKYRNYFLIKSKDNILGVGFYNKRKKLIINILDKGLFLRREINKSNN